MAGKSAERKTDEIGDQARRGFGRPRVGKPRKSHLLPRGETANGGKTDTVATIVPLTFPNIAHEYWENYRLTGDYYLPEYKGRD
ncbi:MAG: hypothetical protein IPP68_08785 [Elusimicrobia bacterium]|nr:hypothetical protein [Elusimicrobiota bacterium]